MKIAIVLNTSWNIYNFRLGLINSLLKNGHEVYAIAPYDEFSSKLIELGCKYEKVTMDSRGANPVKDFVTIESEYPIREVQITNMIGQTVFMDKFNSRQLTIDLGEATQKGIYLITIKTDKSVTTFVGCTSSFADRVE